MGDRTVNSAAIGAALRAFADAALGLAEALEGGAAEVEPVAEVLPIVPRAYGGGTTLGESGQKLRRAAQAHARDRGYDFEHWCRSVRRLRVEVLGCTATQFGAMVGVCKGTVHNWEAGLGFPHPKNLSALEALGEGVAGWTRHNWRTG